MNRLAKRLSTACAGLVVLGLSGAAQAQEQYTLRFNHVLGSSEPFQKVS